MTATSVAPTTAMSAKALCLVADQAHWSRGTSKQTGESFWIIPGSKPATAHYTTSYGCTCKSFEVRAVCSHIEAVRVAQAVEDERLNLASVAEVELACMALAASKLCRRCGEAPAGGRSGLCATCCDRLLCITDQD